MGHAGLLRVLGSIRLRISQHLSLIYIAVFGLAVRLLLAPFTAHPFDMYAWYSISEKILSEGPLSFTGLPMTYYTLVPVSYLYSYLASWLHAYPIAFSSIPDGFRDAAGWAIPQGVIVPVVPGWLYNLVVKTPLILSDLFSGLLLYKLVLGTHGDRAGVRVFALWFLNPMLIWVSAVWGQVDSLPALFTILALYMLLKGRLGFSGLSLAVAAAYKLYPALFLVPLTVWIYRQKSSVREAVTLVSTFLASSLILFLPFLNVPFHMASGIFTPQSGSPSMEPSKTFGLTYWSLAPFTGLSSFTVGFMSGFLLSASVFAVTLMAVLRLRGGRVEGLYAWLLLCVAAVFLSYRIVVEQWFIWLLPFLVLLHSMGFVNRLFHWGLSVLALGYSWVNSMFLSFFTPLYAFTPWASMPQQAVAWGVAQVPSISSFRLLGMAALGLSFTLVLLAALLEVGLKNGLTTLGLKEH